MKTILFIGDSITDSYRNRENDRYRGSGWATMTAGKIALDYPGKYDIINRGIGGNRTVDLLARIKSDCINLKPDIMTVMIGVNDVWHEVDYKNGVSVEYAEVLYDLFIRQVRQALPNTKIFILEPFAFKGCATEKYWDVYQHEMPLRSQISRRIAEKYSLPFIELRDKLQALVDETSVAYVCYDGVHPTCAGHELISREVYDALKSIL